MQLTSGLPLWAADAAFVAVFGGLCYTARPATLDAANSVLVAAVVASFLVGGADRCVLRPPQPSHAEKLACAVARALLFPCCATHCRGWWAWRLPACGPSC